MNRRERFITTRASVSAPARAGARLRRSRVMRNVLVTGGSRGLGLAIASRLAACGYRVIALARRETEDLRSAIEHLAIDARQDSGKGGTVKGEMRFRAFDLGALDSLGALVRELRSDVGPLYGLVNNAGIGTSGLLSMARDPDIEALVRLNVLSPILLTKYVVRAMMDDREGRVVN